MAPEWQQSFPAAPPQAFGQQAGGVFPPGASAGGLDAFGSTAYYGRVLFVGNLPFQCQWQDLKDLFRAAGDIQRADVAIGPEGRSRGFGTVLFATPEDAQNAVRLYHG
jgi:RNA recognition motif-containing protein